MITAMHVSRFLVSGIVLAATIALLPFSFHAERHLETATRVEGGQALATIVAALKDQPGVSGVVSYLELRDPIFLGRGGGTFVLVGLTSADGPAEALVP